MVRIQAGFIVDLGIFKRFVGDKLGSLYDRAERVFLAFKEKEMILSYSVAIILISSYDLGKVEEVLNALEAATPKLVYFNGDYRQTPNEQLINEIVERFNLV